MRIPDRLFQSDFLLNLNATKSRLSKIQEQITTRSKINRPSDSPAGNARLLRLNSQLTDINTYRKNIELSKAIVDTSINALDGIQTETQNVLVQLAQLSDATVSGNFEAFAGKIDMALDELIGLANSDFNGRYLFGGTDFSTVPLGFDGTGNLVEIKSTNPAGEQKVKISKSIEQKINLTAKELFASVLKQTGNVDSTAGIGAAQPGTSTVYDADGNSYTFNFSYTQTAANTYDLTYSIEDQDSNIILPDTTNVLVFDPASGVLQSIDGNTHADIRINVAGNKIDFRLDVASMRETTSASSFRSSLNQKADIFNTLKSIKESLLNGDRPSTVQMEIVSEFNQHILDKLSEAGNVSVRLDDTLELLENQELELKDLITKEKDVDVVKALVDLENQQYNLDLSYKISSIILPKSLLDYL